MTLTERIDLLIQERGLSRRRLAINAGIPPSSLQSAMERGRNITFDMLDRIANALDVPVQALMGYEVLGKTPNGINLYGLRGEYVAFEDDYSKESLLQAFSLLNEQGRIKAVERTKELTEIPRYQRQPKEPLDETFMENTQDGETE